MIYTVTFNPAIDYVVRTDNLISGEVNRSQNEEIFFGGKGINVSLVLNQLSVASRALGFIAGFTGKAIAEGIEAAGVESDFVVLHKGFSRINVKIKSDKETELNGQGPEITEKDINALFIKLERLNEGDILILAGSIPNTLPENMYERIIRNLEHKKIKVVVDATNDLLVNVLKYKPFLIKPNNIELGEIFSKELTTDDEIIEAAKELQKRGAQNVLVSMAGSGAILVDETGVSHRIKAPDGKVVNSVGAGDSMVAGFVAGYFRTNDYDYALKLGTAAGSATAFSKGLAEKETINAILNSIK